MTYPDDEQNPYAPPKTHSDSIEHAEWHDDHQLDAPSWTVGMDRMLIAGMIITCFIGAPLAFNDIETIIGSGIAITIAGILLFIRELYCRTRGRPSWTLSMLLALSGPLFAAGVTGMIIMFSWSPAEAVAHHIDRIVAVAAACFVLLAVFAIANPPNVRRR